MNERIERKWVTVSEAARMLGVSRTHVYELLTRGKLHRVDLSGIYQHGGPQRIPLAEVLALLPKPLQS